jgi:hypothetical protein
MVARKAAVVVLMICPGLFLVARARAERNDPQANSVTQGRFSRSEWIAARMGRVPFSGSVVPNQAPLPVPIRAAPGLKADLSEALTSEPVRVDHDLLASDTAGEPGTHAEPYIAANPLNPNNLIAGCQQNRFSGGGARALDYAVSFDGGQTWTEALLPNLTVVSSGPWEKASDPWVAFGPGNRAYYSSLLFNNSTADNAVGVSTSTDGGATWSAPVQVGRTSVDFNDKDSIAVDTFPASPNFGNVYVTWDINVGGAADNVPQRMVVARSLDGGRTFQEPVVLRGKGSNIGSIARIGPDGSLYLVWAGGAQNAAVFTIFFSKSRDGGLTWGPNVKLGKIRSSGVDNIRAGEILPSFALDPANGDLYVAWEDHRWTGVDQATVMYSRDGGETWTAPARVSDGPDDAPAFTVAVAAANGRVALSYYSLQNDPQLSFLVDEYVTVSQDRGATFQPSLRATRSSFDIRFASQSGGFFLGDYAGLASAGSGFQLLWIDTHVTSAVTGKPEPDVFTASTQ